MSGLESDGLRDAADVPARRCSRSSVSRIHQETNQLSRLGSANPSAGPLYATPTMRVSPALRRMFCARGLTYVYYFSRHSYSAIGSLVLRSG
jgi:hypothetical protein